MGDVYYAPLIQGMRWSSSRIKLFESCPYSWYLKYICELTRKSSQFFSSYGSFMHELLERFYSGKIKRQDAMISYLAEFDQKVTGRPPNLTVFSNYYADGLSFLRSMERFPFDVIATEQKVEFQIDSIPLVGFIDCIGRCEDGLVIVDHKSRVLKPRSNRKKPTKTDLELDDYYRQLYLYAEAVKQQYGEYPYWLCFNCFREKMFIKERFDEQKLEETKRWLAEKVEQITNTTDFPPNWDYFKCNYLCDMCDHCEYHEMNSK